MNITTPDEAIALVSRVEFKNNPDFTYAGFPNQDGSFEVVVRSRSLQKGGGSGTVGRYRVTRDGNFTLIS
ncbi:MAG: hypothetical protein Q4A22_06425 [Kocuria sp.]|nr:hypothetical protein [Kocuria sp.]